MRIITCHCSSSWPSSGRASSLSLWPRSESPVNADGDEVEDGGGGADDVHGQVEVANPHRQVPLSPIHLVVVVCWSWCHWKHLLAPVLFTSPTHGSIQYVQSARPLLAPRCYIRLWRVKSHWSFDLHPYHHCWQCNHRHHMIVRSGWWCGRDWTTGDISVQDCTSDRLKPFFTS